MPVQLSRLRRIHHFFRLSADSAGLLQNPALTGSAFSAIYPPLYLYSPSQKSKFTTGRVVGALASGMRLIASIGMLDRITLACGADDP